MRFDKLLILCGLIFIFGCAKLEHLEELLTLKDLSDNQAEQVRYVQDQDKKFEALLLAIKDSQINQYRTKKDFLKFFGEPILKKPIIREGKSLDEWLYRYTKKFIGSEKVYVYFDDRGRFVNFRHVLPETEGKVYDSSTQETQIQTRR